MRLVFAAAAFAAAPAWAADDSLVAHLTGPLDKGDWIAGGGTCRRPDLTFALGGMGLTVRFSQSGGDGSSASFSTAEAEGEPTRFTLRFSRIDAESLQMTPHRFAGQIDGARLTLTDAEGARRVYTRCDAGAPARNWEME